MCLVESVIYFKKHSVDRLLYRLQSLNILMSEFVYTDPVVRWFLTHNELVILRPHKSAGRVNPLHTKQRYCK